jgi:hypothetical protein
MLFYISNKGTAVREAVLLVGNKKHTKPILYPPMWGNEMQKYYHVLGLA